VRRIVIVLPCCIGDVILATAALVALRRAYPDAHIAWAVGAWSRAAIDGHPALNAVIDTGADANPLKSPRGFVRMVRLLRAQQYDILVSLVRSPLMSAAALMSGIPVRAGLDSGGRGFGYTHRAHVDPDLPRHEAEIYLDAVRALGIDPGHVRASVPVHPDALTAIRARLREAHIAGRYLVVHPGGGRNPGMTLDAKRYPPDKLAALADALARHLDAAVVVIGAPGDRALVEAVARALNAHHVALTDLTFGQIAALASESALYIGNDTGMTHLAAAAGAPTVALFGPTDPRRYAPYGETVLTLWRETAVAARGVTDSAPSDWDWDRDGVGVEEGTQQIVAWLTPL